MSQRFDVENSGVRLVLSFFFYFFHQFFYWVLARALLGAAAGFRFADDADGGGAERAWSRCRCFTSWIN